MRYDPDLNSITLDAYRKHLKRQTLLPSRRLLLDDVDEHFARIQSQGIKTVAALLKALSSPAKTESFAAQSGVPARYLTILKREIGTLKPKVVPLRDFPGVNAEELDALRRQGIQTSKAYFESRKADGELYVLCDLARINGVGPSAAKMLYEAGYRSPAGVAAADAGTMLARVAAVNADGRYYARKLGEKDMQFCIDSARLLDTFG